MDLHDMRWSSASPKAIALPVDFSKELLDMVRHRGQRKNQPDSRSFRFKQNPTLRKFRQIDVIKPAGSSSLSTRGGLASRTNSGRNSFFH
jgi:hypothetical protein